MNCKSTKKIFFRETLKQSQYKYYENYIYKHNIMSRKNEFDVNNTRMFQKYLRI